MQTEIRLLAPVDLCAFVDSVGAGEVGHLEVKGPSGRPIGGIFVQEERVCWVAAAGLAARLRELLLQRTKVDARGLGRHIARCRDRKLVLADELVARDIIGAAELRDVFAAHSAECLARLCGADVIGTWTARESAYAPRYSFATSELLARTGALAREAKAAEITPRLLFELEDTAAGAWAAAFVRGAHETAAAPIAAVGAYPATATALLDAGRWGAAALDAAPAASVESSPVSSRIEAHDEERTMRAIQLADAFIVVDSGFRARPRSTVPYFSTAPTPSVGSLE